MQEGDVVCMREMLYAGRRCGLHAGDVVCRQEMWSVCRRCMQAGDVVCMREIGNLPKL